ncbi:MAG: hypothetical protein AAB946_01205 [Patescibacteria group bacterium]
MLLCAVPLVILIFTQRGSGTSWLVWLLVGGCVVAHIIMMLKRRGGHTCDDTEDKSGAEDTTKQSETKIEHDNKRGGCCH